MAYCLAIALSVPNVTLAVGGTRPVATKGKPAFVSPSWPEGVGQLVNDPLRTWGYNSWYSEWPNDINQYAFKIKSINDANRLIAKLAAIKADLRQIRLSHLKEPRRLGLVTRLPEGNGIPIIFSIGDQAQIDFWFKRARKPFGPFEFTAAPEAVPPTLTIFVQNESVKLEKLKIPDGIDVSIGYVPTGFHKWNTKISSELDGYVAPVSENFKQKLDEPSLGALKRVEAFLDSRRRGTKR
jgi:hypothetical protein